MTTHTEHALDPKAEAKTYTLTLALLLILTAITVGASYIQFGSLNVVIALGIATIKASLVALFFMHLRHDKPVNAVIACAGFLFLGLFLLFTFLDVDTRALAVSKEEPRHFVIAIPEVEVNFVVCNAAIMRDVQEGVAWQAQRDWTVELGQQRGAREEVRC